MKYIDLVLFTSIFIIILIDGYQIEKLQSHNKNEGVFMSLQEEHLNILGKKVQDMQYQIDVLSELETQQSRLNHQ